MKREKHGESGTDLYKTWAGMKSRCNNKNHPSFKYYGGKGVFVCDDWSNSFISFRDWAIAVGYNGSLQIDRIYSDGNYEPANCRFVTRKENLRRTRISLHQEALKYMKENGLFWTEPRLVKLPRHIFSDLFYAGICERRLCPYSNWVYQYKIKVKP